MATRRCTGGCWRRADARSPGGLPARRRGIRLGPPTRTTQRATGRTGNSGIRPGRRRGRRGRPRSRAPELARPQVGRQPIPDLAPAGDRDEHRIHAEQRDAAQDEREDRRLELRTAGIAGRRDGPAAASASQHVWQRRPADRVDRACPAFRLERPALGGHLVAWSGSRPPRASGAAPASSACRSRPRPRSRGRPGSPGPYAADPARRAGHEHRPRVGLEAALLEGRPRTSRR